ncbi:hypothetical protein DEO72_LG5g2154 [Vigna unguiculata]|uniref:Uncharacterized protein n=1 Tax=Vigna unguiculata TaxID=3917 RepID=A0A4D6M1L9_VIGUN|nr:hypothetical protein DEO72_LG5g2154 [Vigna unguiculata]
MSGISEGSEGSEGCEVGDCSDISQIVHDLCLSKEEVGALVVKEALPKDDGECDKSKRKECVSGGTKKKEQLMSVIEQQEHDIPELGGAIANEVAEDKDVTNSDMYVGMRNDPRLRFKSRVIQTPFAVYSRKKKMIPK